MAVLLGPHRLIFFTGDHVIETKALKATLYCTESNADKVYVIWIDKVKGKSTGQGGYVVNAQWGRRGGAMQSGTKTKNPVSMAKAEAIMEKVLKEKQALRMLLA